MNRKRKLDLIVDGLAVFGLALAVAFIATVLATGANAQAIPNAFNPPYIVQINPGPSPYVPNAFGGWRRY